MKTVYKITIGAFAFLIVVILYLVASRSLAQRAAAGYADELMNRFGQPALNPGENPFEQNSSMWSSLPTTLSDLYTGHDKLPELMRRMPSGRARVSWQRENLSGPGSHNIWPQVQSALDAKEVQIRFLMDCVDPSSSISEDQRKAARMYGWVAGTWMSGAMVDKLYQGDGVGAAELALAIVRTGHNKSGIMQFGPPAMGAYAAVWEFLQSTNLTDDVLKELADAVMEDRPIDRFDKSYRSMVATLTGSLRMMREQPENMLADYLGGSPAMMGGAGVSGWGDFFSTLTSDPGASFKWLGMRAKMAKYLWRDTYEDELWALEDVAVDWEGMHIGLKTNAMSEGLAWARAARKGRGKPGSNLLLSHMGSSFWGLGGAGPNNHLHMLTHLVGEEMRHRMMLTAIALHRHRLAEGSLPSELADLVPRYLDEEPVDLMDGKSLRYDREKDGRFRLWSIGCYAGDNHGSGKPHTIAGPSTAFGFGNLTAWLAAADWIWPQPANEKEISTDDASLAGTTVPTFSSVTVSTSSP